MVDSDSRKLIENSLDLQKVAIKLVDSNNALVKRIDTLVGLFEEAAKNISSGNTDQVFNLNKKINELVEQNKQLARGLVLMEDKLKKSGIQAKPIRKL
jgi:hypothetical protein